MEFYEIGDQGQMPAGDTIDQSSVSGSVDQRAQPNEEIKEQTELAEIRNDVMDAIQYTQNDDGTMRVIDNLNLDGLVEELKQDISDRDNKVHVD